MHGYNSMNKVDNVVTAMYCSGCKNVKNVVGSILDSLAIQLT